MREKARPGSSGFLKCRWCRGTFERPAHLPAEMAAVDCGRPACREMQRARELSQRRALEARRVESALETELADAPRHPTTDTPPVPFQTIRDPRLT